MFTIADIQARLRQQPFVPMRIVTSLGDTFDITKPGMVMTGVDFLLIGTPSRRNPEILESTSRVALSYIVDVQNIPEERKPMFTAEDIQKRVKLTPFVPLRIVTSSGQSYDVRHPDLIWIGRRYLYVGTASNDNPQVFDGESRIALLHISDLQDMPNPQPAGKNGESS